MVLIRSLNMNYLISMSMILTISNPESNVGSHEDRRQQVVKLMKVYIICYIYIVCALYVSRILFGALFKKLVKNECELL